MPAAQTTVSDIAVALAITRGIVYRYFAGTDELFTAVAEVALGRSRWSPTSSNGFRTNRS
ncbi:TetR family transcriptional regulator [Mycobacterium sp. B14F4]|uniref:TetR family transcriptional regulator n=1 Tax=Mycobacterium sp. B14F4 TaxID=3153565 RepID=UPI00325E8C88